jgi:hypothetical protein
LKEKEVAKDVPIGTALGAHAEEAVAAEVTKTIREK